MDSKKVVINYIKFDIEQTLESGLMEDVNAQLRIIDNYCLLLNGLNINSLTQTIGEYLENQRSLARKMMALQNKKTEIDKEIKNLGDSYSDNARMMLDAIKDL